MCGVLACGLVIAVLALSACQTTQQAYTGPTADPRTQLPREFRDAMVSDCAADSEHEFGNEAENVCRCIVDKIADRMNSNDMLRFIARLVVEAGDDEEKIQKMVNQNAAISSSIYACLQEEELAARQSFVAGG